jgi:Kef-type K+ transport system membrane component KefB
MHGLLSEIGIAILAATLLGFVFQLFRQPVILGYLLAGAFIGPEIGLRLVVDPSNIQVISEIGLILLLFIIGLELNPAKMLSSGRQLVYSGVGQFIFCVLIGFGFFLLWDKGIQSSNIDALYLAIFCALSSTAIVVKLLYDKFELDTLPGRITLGILIFQDIWAILVLALQPHFTNPKLHLVVLALGKSVFLLSVGFVLSKYLLKWVFEKISKNTGNGCGNVDCLVCGHGGHWGLDWPVDGNGRPDCRCFNLFIPVWCPRHRKGPAFTGFFPYTFFPVHRYENPCT